MFTGVGGHHGMEYDDLLYDDVEVGGFFTFFLYMIGSVSSAQLSSPTPVY